VGSIEFAAERFGVRLVLVLGHSQCGAVQAALEEFEQPSEEGSPNLGFIVRSILPGVQSAVARVGLGDRVRLAQCAVRENISVSARHLRQGSEVLERLIADNGLLVVGAEYSLETGIVDFFDGVPAGD
jgi:carbonic anhydrase